MKNFKKTLSFVLALTLVCAAALIPASAASGSDSFFVKYEGYNCNATLNMDDYSATATFNATEGGGAVVPDPHCEIEGSLLYTTPGSVSKKGSVSLEDDGSLSASAYGEVPNGYISISANCIYTLNGTNVGTLSV